MLRNFQYGINALGQRETLTREDSSVLSFGYDSRRQVVSGQERGTGVSPVFDLNGSTLTRLKTHTWGLDLSGTAQGAGGVGGLLATVDETTATPAIYHFVYDGNGNVAALYQGANTLAASYEYSPFGQVIASSGSYALENKYRFSTKPQDRIGSLNYYGYRYYDPMTGRWPSRDPIAEKGGMNLYGFVGNNAVDKRDFLGLVPEGVEEIWLWGDVIKVEGGYSGFYYTTIDGREAFVIDYYIKGRQTFFRDEHFNPNNLLDSLTGIFFQPCNLTTCKNDCYTCCAAATVAFEANSHRALISRTKTCADLKHPAAVVACELGNVAWYLNGQASMSRALTKCTDRCSGLK